MSRRSFDDDHLGAQVGEQHAGVRTGPDAFYLDDSVACKWAHALTPHCFVDARSIDEQHSAFAGQAFDPRCDQFNGFGMHRAATQFRHCDGRVVVLHAIDKYRLVGTTGIDIERSVATAAADRNRRFTDSGRSSRRNLVA